MGWVGDHGPHPKDVDRTGKEYGARARGMRLVLLAVADCANPDGQHAHPGIQNVARFSLYSTGQARRLLEELEAEGWLQVTDQGGGRGKATVYRVPMDLTALAERRASRAPSDGTNARIEPPQTRAPQPDTRASGPDTRASGSAPNGLATEATEAPTGTPPARGRPKVTDAARAVTDEVWERSGDIKPAVPYIAIAKIADRLLTAGHEHDAIVGAMLAARTISIGWVEAELRRRNPTAARTPTIDRDAPTGRIVL